MIQTLRPHADLIRLSADPLALNPDTIRQVLRQEQILDTRDGKDLEFFLDCVTVRKLLRDNESARATLIAENIGSALEAFQ